MNQQENVEEDFGRKSLIDIKFKPALSKV